MAMDLVQKLEERGASVEPLSKKEVKELWQRWCEIYCQPVKARTGSYCYKGIFWHTYSWNFFPSKSGQKALTCYQSEPLCPVLIIPEPWPRYPEVRCSAPQHLDLSDLLLDLYVFPETLDWTLVFTHEQPSIGPFFAKREWHIHEEGGLVDGGLIRGDEQVPQK